MKQSGPERFTRWRSDSLLLLAAVAFLNGGFVRTAAAQTAAERYAILYGTTTEPDTSTYAQNSLGSPSAQEIITAISAQYAQENPQETPATTANTDNSKDEEIIVTAPRLESFSTVTDARFEPRSFMAQAGITLYGNENLAGLDQRTLTLEERRQGPQGATIDMFGARANESGFFMKSRIEGGNSGVVIGLHF